MSFEAIISLILFLLFVIVPAFSGKGKEGEKPQTPGRPKPRSGGEADRRSRPAQTAQPSARPSAASADDDSLERRLREARRRIEEAMGETHSELPPQPAAPAPARAERPRSLTSRPAKTLTRRPATPGPAPATTAAVREQPAAVAARRQRERAAAERRSRQPRKGADTGPQVTTQTGSQSYTGRRRPVSAGQLLSVEGLHNGLIWHQILSEPPHRRGRRRISRLRSP